MDNDTRRDQKRPDNSTHRPKSILECFDSERRIIAATKKLLEQTEDKDARFRIRDGAQLAIVRLGGA